MVGHYWVYSSLFLEARVVGLAFSKDMAGGLNLGPLRNRLGLCVDLGVPLLQGSVRVSDTHHRPTGWGREHLTESRKEDAAAEMKTTSRVHADTH